MVKLTKHAAADCKDPACPVHTRGSVSTDLKKAQRRIKALEAALKPFADFTDAYLEWRAPNGFVLQHESRKDIPVLRWVKPVPYPTTVTEKLELWADDFRRAREVLEKGNKR